MRRKWTRTEKTLPDLTCSSFPLPAGMLKSSNIRSTEVHLGKRSRASRDETAGLPPPNLMEKPAGSSENIYCQSGRWEKAILGGLDLLALPGNLGISYSHIEFPLIPKHPPTSETTNKRIPNKPHTLNTSSNSTRHLYSQIIASPRRWEIAKGEGRSGIPIRETSFDIFGCWLAKAKAESYKLQEIAWSSPKV